MEAYGNPELMNIHLIKYLFDTKGPNCAEFKKKPTYRFGSRYG
jgi:hypothetical protein